MADMDRQWAAYAACRGMDPEIFFPTMGKDGREAKKVCAVCAVREECLAYAEWHKERIGIWGGLTAPERRKRRREGIV